MDHHPDASPASDTNAVADPPPLVGRRRRVVELLDRAIGDLVTLQPRYVDRYLHRLESALHGHATACTGDERRALRVAPLRLRMFRAHWSHRPDPDDEPEAELRWHRDVMAMVTIDLPRIREAVATFDRSRLTPLRLDPPKPSRAATRGAAKRRKRRASR